MLSPYNPVANEEVLKFLSDHGFETVRDICLRRPGWTAVAEVDEATIREAVSELDRNDVDAIVQVGPNLRLLAEH